MVSATIMNAKRTKASHRVWTIEDFIGSIEKPTGPKMQTDEDIMALMMKSFPPQQELM